MAPASPESDMPVVSFHPVADERSKAKSRRVSSTKRKRADADGDWHDLVWLVAPLAGAPSASHSAAQGSGGLEVSSGASSSAGQMAGAQPIADATLAAVATGGPSAEPMRAIVEGVEVHEEAHGVIGQPGSYRRLIVRCGQHGGPRAQCRKTRSFGTREGQRSGLGDIEPFAFLGAWLKAHSKFEDAATHKRYSPGVEEVHAYAVENRWTRD